MTSPGLHRHDDGVLEKVDDVVTLARVRNHARSGRARRARLLAGLSLSEVAGPIGVSPVTIFRWETGERRPTGEAALRYADLLDALDGQP